MNPLRILSSLLLVGLLLYSTLLASPAEYQLVARTNLMAWCMVPFDARKRGPEERAAMLEQLGFKHYQVQILERLKQDGVANAGLVYNLHHGHDHLDRFTALLQRMKPHLLVLNLNGMTRSGDKAGKKILPLGQGDLDLDLLKVIRDSGWHEPIGILNHTDEDAEARLRDNLDGLDWLLPQLEGKPPGPRLAPRSWRGPVPPSPPKKPAGQASLAPAPPCIPMLLEVGRALRCPPQMQVGLHFPARSGVRALLQAWFYASAARCYQQPRDAPPAPGPDDLLSSGIPSPDPWAVEDARARAVLPEFKEIPAAKADGLTPASGWPRAEAMTNWHRSMGDATSSRFSALAQIHRENVNRLEVAWTYHSQDGAGNLQCNPIIVDGVMFAPTAGHHIVALDAGTGAELWRFKPEIRRGGMGLEDFPARRGLIFWPGDGEAKARILFTCGNWIYALDPKTGRTIDGFGQHGRTVLPAGGTVAGAVYKNVLVMPGFNRDVFGYDIHNGKLLWTFHTLPKPGEFGRDTWSRVEDGANCWGGMALDESRGVAYVATGSPKPNFVGTGHHGDNLFANCILALDALTGKRLWHFQEIRHDIWDWDIPAPPNLVTVTREGRRVDAVAQVTKLGNTLLLDRITGQPLFPVRLRRAPVSKLPGERTAPYQPDLELPEPFSRQQFSHADVTTRSEEAREFVEKRVAGANVGWFEPFEEGKPTVLYSIHGGAEWTGAAFDPTSGFLYVSANEIPWIVTVFRDDDEPPHDPKHPTLGEKLYQQNCASCHGSDRVGVGAAPPLRGLRHRLGDAEVLALLQTGRNLMPVAPPMTAEERRALLDFLFLRDRVQPANQAKPARPAYTHNGYPKLLDHENYPGNKPPWGTLNCLDLNTGRLRWKVPLGEHPELTAQGVSKTGTENFGGAMVTAGGLVFCSGTRDNMIRAFDAATGQELWSHKLPLHGTAPPATYAVKGRQFVVLAATGGGKLGGPTGDSWVAFALPESIAGR